MLDRSHGNMYRLRGFWCTIVICIALIAINRIDAGVIHDEFPGFESEAFQGMLKQRFYGPWKTIQKVNGEYADYNDYGARIQPDYQSQPEANPAEVPQFDEVADFPSQYDQPGEQQDDTEDHQDGYAYDATK